MDPAATSLVVLAGAVVLFVWNRLPVGVVAIGTALALYATGVLDAGAALAGFGDPVVVFVATLFVLSEALDSTGVTAWAGQALTRRAGTGRRRSSRRTTRSSSPGPPPRCWPSRSPGTWTWGCARWSTAHWSPGRPASWRSWCARARRS